MLMAATMPSVPSAPSMVSRVQWPARDCAVGAAASRAPGGRADHVGQCGALVEEDEALRRDRLKRDAPILSGLGDHSLVPLGGAWGLLFCAVSRQRRSARPTVQGWTQGPVSAARLSRDCARVR